MARSRYNYLCITEDGEVKKYAAQSIGQILDETPYEYKSIIREDLHGWEEDYEKLEWHD